MKRIATILILLAAVSASASAQNSARMLSFDFKGALEEYRDSLAHTTDSLRQEFFKEGMTHARNAISMMEFCYQPSVVTRQKFSSDDYYLYYPLPDHSWHRTQDSIVVYHPGFVPDTLLRPRRDSLEFMAMECGDERYFASKELPGMGGYDLFVQKRTASGSWGPAQNLGFPFSSPADDFLYINTPDGKYTIFSSNRECGKDSVYVYVLEYESTPVRKSVTDLQELRRLCSLEPAVSSSAMDNSSVVSADDSSMESTRLYRSMVAEVRAVRDTLSMVSRSLREGRESYVTASSDVRAVIGARLMEEEMRLGELNARLDEVSRKLRNLEMDFLQNGVMIDLSKFAEESDHEVVGADKAYTFSRKHLGNETYYIYKEEE